MFNIPRSNTRGIFRCGAGFVDSTTGQLILLNKPEKWRVDFSPLL